MSLRANLFVAALVCAVCWLADGALNVSIVSDSVGDPVGVYQAATPVELSCIDSGFSSPVTYSWTCSGEYNCFTKDLTQPSKKRGILRGGDTGIHTCTVTDGGTNGTASTNISVTGIGLSYKGLGTSFHYVVNNSAIFIAEDSAKPGLHTLANLECASGTTSANSKELLFIVPSDYKDSFVFMYEPGLWKLASEGGNHFLLQSFNGGVFTCRMPDENGVVLDASVGIYPVNYNENNLAVSLSYQESNSTLTLNCTSTGLPPTAVTWRKNGLEISIGDGYNFIQRVIDMDNTVYESILVIKKGSTCEVQHLYQCIVQCFDDLGVSVSNANDSVNVTVSTSCVTSSLSNTMSSSFTNNPTTIISSSALHATPFTESFVATSSKIPSQTTPFPIETTETITTATSAESPTEQELPLSEEALYAIVAGGGAVVASLLVFVMMCCCCILLKRRRKQNGDQEKVSEMQQFGKTPSEKAMAETLMNVTKEISPGNGESIPLIHDEELVAIPSSKSVSSVEHEYEDMEGIDKHDYKKVKVAREHEYEEVNATMVSIGIQEKDQIDEKSERENEEEPKASSDPESEKQCEDEQEKDTGKEREKENGKEPKNESEEEQSDLSDLEVTAVDGENEEAAEPKPEETLEAEANGKLVEREVGLQREEGVSEVEVEPQTTSIVVEAEVEDEGTPIPSSTHSLGDTTLDEAVVEQSIKGETDEIPLAEFGEHVRKLHENSNELFLKEYESLPMRMTKSHEVGTSESNINKNRFKDIIAYDHSRVLLKEGPGIVGTDYINANYLHGWQKENMYIAAQGPTSKTVADFWRMVWEQKLSTIVMLTKCVEAGKTKCQQYWPNNLKMTTLYDSGVRVTLDNVTSFAEYEYRKMTVKSSLEADAPPMKVTHFQYTAWPDHGVPQQSNSLIAFIRRVRVSHPPSNSVPLLVHCSAGVGRSGTFIALDALMLQMKDVSTVNVYGFVKGMREQRVQMVQTDAQYIFLHNALDELIKYGDTSIESSKLPSLVRDFKENKADLDKQFQTLVESSSEVNEKNCSDGLSPANADKNRTGRVVPFNSNRVMLRSTKWKEQCYINASLLDNYSHRMGFIATQTPLPNTVKDFWQMVWNFPCRVVVTLNKEEEKLFVMEQGVEVEVGQTTVILDQEEEVNGYSKRVYQISNSTVATGHSEKKLTVTQFQLRTLPMLVDGSSTAFLDMINSVANIQRATGNKPIAVMCPDGSGCSGVFMVVYSQLEKLKVEGLVDIFQCIKTMRTKRPGIVADVEQYELCFHILADYLLSIETYSNFQPSTFM